MKAEAIQTAQEQVASLQQQLVIAVRQLVEAVALPDDPVVFDPAPGNLRITESYGGVDTSLTIHLGADPVPGLQIEYRGHASDPNGPQEWTSLQVSPIPNAEGSVATISLWPLTDRQLEVRAFGSNTEIAMLEITTNSAGTLNV